MKVVYLVTSKLTCGWCIVLYCQFLLLSNIKHAWFITAKVQFTYPIWAHTLGLGTGLIGLNCYSKVTGFKTLEIQF